MRSKISLLTIMCLVGSTLPISAAEVKLVTRITVPGEPLRSFDIGFVDQKTQRYFLTDRSNKSLDIFDAKEDTFLGRVDGFVGRVEENGKVVNSKSGPDGVVVFGDEAWVGDGDSTIKIVDLNTMKISDVISTGGKKRVDEMAFDPVDQVFIGVNNADQPAFATLISTKPGHKIIGRIEFPNASDGVEQPAFNPGDGLFYISVPEVGKNVKKGQVALIDPGSAKLVKTLSVENCHPGGLAFGPEQNFILGCAAHGEEGLPPIITIMNAKTGKVVRNIKGVGGADMVAFDGKTQTYYSASTDQPGGPALGVIDAKQNELLQLVRITGGNPHSVAVNESNGEVFIPVGISGGGCGCIEVYAPQ